MPRPVVSKLASVGSECEPKIASLERNKRDVAPRTQCHVRADRHDYGFHGRGLKQGAKLVRRVARCANLLAAESPIGTGARSPRRPRGLQYLANDATVAEGPRLSTAPHQLAPHSRRPRRKSKQIWSCEGQYNATPALTLRSQAAGRRIGRLGPTMFARIGCDLVHILDPR